MPTRFLPLAATALMLAFGILSAASAADAKATGPGVFKYCRGCHGDRAMGGELGRYPRLAGLPKGYIERQLKAFKTRKRINKPMIPIFNNYRFDDDVIAIVAEHIADMNPRSLGLWPYQPLDASVDAFSSRQAFNDAGRDAFRDGCASCHGIDGQGIAVESIPPLVNQYPRYLAKQMDDFAAGKRLHKAAAECGSLLGPQREAVLHHLVELGRDRH